MASDIYGVVGPLDSSAALATGPSASNAWDGVYRFRLGRSVLELPEDDLQLANALLGIYLANGVEGVTIAWEAARAALDGFATPSAAEQAIAELRTGYGTALQHEQSYARLEQDLLASNPGVASRPTLAASRAHNAEFRHRLLATIDDILGAEEEAQRWYEGKLIQLIEADLAHQKARAEEAWSTRYDVGFADKPGRQGAAPIGGDHSPGKLKIRTTTPSELVEATVYGAAGTIQGATSSTIKALAVAKALHEVGTLYFEYRRQLQARIDANKQRQRVGAAALAIEDLPAYPLFRTALREQGAKHFVVYATFRNVIEKAVDKTFTQEMHDRCERLVIEALRAAWKNCDVVTANARADRLFVDDKVSCLVGRDTIGVSAARVVAARKYKPPPPPRPTPVTPTPEPPPPIARSPWLQAPFHERMLAVSRAVRSERASAASLIGTPVDHLKPLFQSKDDREKLAGLNAFGSFTARAREEMVGALTARAELDQGARRDVAKAVGLLGLVGAPFSGGASLVMAGILDAALVAGQASDRIAQWIAAEQYSALVVDELTAEAWLEPAVSEFMAILFEAGFQIAGDLVQNGPVAKFFAAVALTELLAAGASLGIAALTEEPAKP